MKRFIYFLPAVLLYGGIFFMSSRSFDVKVEFRLFDKVAHILVFAVFGLLLSLGFFKALKSSFLIKGFLVLLSGFLLGILDEVHQSFVPERELEILDMIADGVGIMIGLCVYLIFIRKFRYFKET